MKSLQPYLNFDGNTREVMTFYQACLGGDLQIQSFGDTNMPGDPNRTMHSHLTSGPTAIMASDTMPGMSLQKGNNTFLCIDTDNVDELERLFSALSAGGQVMQPPQDTFWGARFGMLTDKFGVQWMFNCDLPKK